MSINPMTTPDETLNRDTSDPLLRPSVVAKILGVHKETVWRWVRKGVVPCERIGPYRKIRIRTSVVEAMQQRGTAA